MSFCNFVAVVIVTGVIWGHVTLINNPFEFIGCE